MVFECKNRINPENKSTQESGLINNSNTFTTLSFFKLIPLGVK
jgi:hypothetical protein